MIIDELRMVYHWQKPVRPNRNAPCSRAYLLTSAPCSRAYLLTSELHIHHRMKANTAKKKIADSVESLCLSERKVCAGFFLYYADAYRSRPSARNMQATSLMQRGSTNFSVIIVIVYVPDASRDGLELTKQSYVYTERNLRFICWWIPTK